MAITISTELADVLAKEDTVKLLVTTDEQGIPHAVVKKSLRLDSDTNRLLYLELLESSQTNKNMVRSIWFNRVVTVAVIGAQGESYQIKGRPIKAIVSGHAFRKYYSLVREKKPEADLAAVWVIEPVEIIDERFSVRLQQETAAHPYFQHLDQLAHNE